MSVKTVFYKERVYAEGDKFAQRLVTILGSEYTNAVKTLMRNSPASGRTYGRHQASAPGEPPAPDTGKLVQSIRFQVRKAASGWLAEAGSTLRYALHLEFGAARLSKPPALVRRSARQTGKEASWILFPRPAWLPALQQIRMRMFEFISRARKR